jgi:hypothetical protein
MVAMTAAALVDRWPLVWRWDELNIVDRVVTTGSADGVLLALMPSRAVSTRSCSLWRPTRASCSPRI